MKSLSRVQLVATPRTVACQTPPFMGFSRQEYWNGLPFPSAGDLPHPGIEPGSPTLRADSSLSEQPGTAVGHVRKWEVGTGLLRTAAPPHPAAVSPLYKPRKVLQGHWLTWASAVLFESKKGLSGF